MPQAATHKAADATRPVSRKDFERTKKVIDLFRSESIALSKVIEKLERERAKQRQKDHGKTTSGRKKNTSVNLPEVIPADEASDLRDRIGSAIGVIARRKRAIG